MNVSHFDMTITSILTSTKMIHYWQRSTIFDWQKSLHRIHGGDPSRENLRSVQHQWLDPVDRRLKYLDFPQGSANDLIMVK